MPCVNCCEDRCRCGEEDNANVAEVEICNDCKSFIPCKCEQAELNERFGTIENLDPDYLDWVDTQLYW